MNFNVCLSCGRATACRSPSCPIRGGRRLSGSLVRLDRAMMTELPSNAVVVMGSETGRQRHVDPWAGLIDRDWDAAMGPTLMDLEVV